MEDKTEPGDPTPHPGDPTPLGDPTPRDLPNLRPSFGLFTVLPRPTPPGGPPPPQHNLNIACCGGDPFPSIFCGKNTVSQIATLIALFPGHLFLHRNAFPKKYKIALFQGHLISTNALLALKAHHLCTCTRKQNIPTTGNKLASCYSLHTIFKQFLSATMIVHIFNIFASNVVFLF